MTRLSSAKPRLGLASPRLGGAKTSHRKSARRADGQNNTAKWQKLRLKILRRDSVDISDRPHLMPQHVLFADDPWRWPVCQQTGVVLTGGKFAPNSPVVDHIIPHRGDMALFWDENNLQTVSKEYHDKVKQSLEKSGRY